MFEISVAKGRHLNDDPLPTSTSEILASVLIGWRNTGKHHPGTIRRDERKANGRRIA